MKRYRLFNADCLEAMRKLRAGTIDSVVTDPPYGLRFMGRDWDHGVPGVAFWTAVKRVCKPGAMLLAFGGTRTHHRLACAIEDAGWEIRDCLMWLYGQGFPKSLDISKAIDKAAGNQRDRIRDVRSGRDAAQRWDGWGTALKPAWEPIILAMKPVDGTFAQNALKHGVAGINVDGGRIAGANPSVKRRATARKTGHAPTYEGISSEDRKAMEAGGKWCDERNAAVYMAEHPSEHLGRWPANVLLQHHPECVERATKWVNKVFGEDHRSRPAVGYADGNGSEKVEAWDCHPDCPVGMLDRQSGQTTGKRPNMVCRSHKGVGGHGIYGRFEPVATATHGDTGTASRFFYCAKASRRERTMNGKIENGHPTVKPVALLEYLCRLTMTPSGGVVLDPFMGSGTTGVACANVGRRFIGCEIDRKHGYFRIAKRRIAAAYERKTAKLTA